MISGVVNSLLEPVVTLTIRGPRGAERRVKVVVDTGYTGLLTLARELVAELELPWRGEVIVELADGSEVLCNQYDVGIIWDGAVRTIRCEAADTDAFLGTGLLRGCAMNVQFRAGGTVEISPIS